MGNIEVYMDTQRRILENESLYRETQKASFDTYVIDENFTSKKAPSFSKSQIGFEENLTLIAAFRYVDAGKKTAVLNFANPLEPGGGVLRGANAQEEYLCRAGNLYQCLKSLSAESYYLYHYQLQRKAYSDIGFTASDRLIYSPGVLFFREDKGYVPDDDECKPVQEYTDRWRKLDVITCAAPYWNRKGITIPEEKLYQLFISRIRNILEAAIDNDIEALVLGAFGCGAFHNPPGLVADAFRAVFLEERYKKAFSDVTFAVKRSGWFCENIEAFIRAFGDFSSGEECLLNPESNKRRFFE